jgi:uncharacterized protein YbjT (DUF2867 family)
MSTKLIAVVGATGAQGGSLVKALLASPQKLRVRAITRKPGGDKAKQLASLGAEVAVADLDDEASLGSAFQGADGAFCVTNFWEHFSPEKELQQAQNMAQAARKANVKHVVWSTLEDTRKLVPLSDDRMPTLMGKYKVPHFDAKGEANRFFEGLPTTLLHASFYWDNLIYFGMGPKREADGTLAFVLPMGDKKMPGIAAEDIGKCTAAIFLEPEQFIGKTVGIAGEHLSGSEMAAELSRVLGEKVVHRDVPFATYRSFGFPGAEDLGNMFQYYHDFEREFRAARDVAGSRALNPKLQSFAEFVNAHKDQLRPA